MLTRQDIPTEPQASSAWIALNGDFYYVRAERHYDAACAILGLDDWSEDDEERAQAMVADTTLEERGWVHLSGSDVYVRRGAVTQAQLDTLWSVVGCYDDTFYGSSCKSELMTQLNELDVK